MICTFMHKNSRLVLIFEFYMTFWRLKSDFHIVNDPALKSVNFVYVTYILFIGGNLSITSETRTELALTSAKATVFS